jgi:hypothetical protein
VVPVVGGSLDEGVDLALGQVVVHPERSTLATLLIDPVTLDVVDVVPNGSATADTTVPHHPRLHHNTLLVLPLRVRSGATAPTPTITPGRRSGLPSAALGNQHGDRA